MCTNFAIIITYKTTRLDVLKELPKSQLKESKTCSITNLSVQFMPKIHNVKILKMSLDYDIVTVTYNFLYYDNSVVK